MNENSEKWDILIMRLVRRSQRLCILSITLEKALQRYGVTHKLSTTYHPQSNGQTEVTNRAIKRILERSVGYNPKGWSEKLNDALWEFRTTYKTPTWCTPFRLVYGKACHLPVEIEHKAHWALKQCNMDLTPASKSRLMQLNKVAELRDGAYDNTRIYKEQTKKWHDSRLRGDKYFKVGDKVLLYNSRLKMYPGKLKLKWSDPNIVKTVYPHGAIEITDRDGFSFKIYSIAGSDDENPPPPPPPQTPIQQAPHTVSTIKLPILKKGKYDIWAMKMEHYLSHIDYPIWEVIQKGNGPVSVSTDTNGVIKVLPPKTAEEILARERERKARTTLLMALPEDHLAKFHKMTDAKEMWDAIKSRFVCVRLA
ncbi:reverse transcriptase domain-containing protein [Tanacetum coccineum]